jgi:O-succinylbenzoic acid--CoA ligase
MSHPAVPCTALPSEAGFPALEDALSRLRRHGGVVGLAPALELPALREALGEGSGELGVPGAAVVVGSGGSSGRRRWCLQPLASLEASAAATGEWLRGLGIEPSRALVGGS